MSKKVDIPDEIAELIEELRVASGATNFTSALCTHIKLGHQSVMARFADQVEERSPVIPVASPANPSPEVFTALPKTKTELKVLPSAGKSKADKLKSL